MIKEVEHLYQLFSKYKRPDTFQTCECCVSEKDKEFLLSKELASLNSEELSGYAADVFLTVGDVSDFKYFLPRILELSVRDEFSWPDQEVVLSKLSKGNWDSWPQEEVEAITQLLRATYEQLLQAGDDNAYEIDAWICAVGRCVPDITPYLDQLLVEGREDKLIGFVELNLAVYTKGKLRNAFWEKASVNEKQAISWMLQPKVKAVLTERYGMVL